ncbi:MAG: GAF domain-containing protein [Ardenticatenaceae bacterium]|nr:GAF domain-containing protein [Ardenticatenaceae bacterium]
MADLPPFIALKQTAAQAAANHDWETASHLYEQAMLLLEQQQQTETAVRLRTETALQQRNAYLAALHDTAVGLISRRNLDDLLTAIVTRAGQLIGTEHGFMYLETATGEELERKVGLGIFNIDRVPRIQPGEGLSGKIWERNQPLLVNDYPGWPERPPVIDRHLVQAMMGVPLQSGTKAIGVIALAHEYGSDQIFNEDQLLLLQRFGQLASVALDNARLFTSAQDARAAAEQASAAKSAFLASMSHEIRTPLNAIIGFTRIVRRKGVDVLPERQVDNLDKVLTSAEHLLGLINTVLDIAKIEAGRMDVNPSTFDPAILTQMCLVTATPLIRHGVQLENQIAPDLPPMVSDPEKIKQILINLLSNAAKFTHEGRILVSVSFDDTQVRFAVTDSGIGITPAALPRIFEEFQQAESHTRQKYGGTGLGLPISRNLARLLGGDLTAASEVGVGSTFTLTLPRQI